MYKYLLFLIILNITLFIFQTKISNIYNLYDKPDKERKIHKISTPLIGGLIVFINLILYYIYIFINENFIFSENFFSNKTTFSFIILSTATFLIGYYDDKFNLSANKKFILLIFIIYFCILFDKNIVINNLNFTFSSKTIFLENISSLFTLLCILLFVNAFNMFDGINSHAGLLAIIILLVLLFVGVKKELIYSLIIPLCLFLIFNFSGKMFLGNTGSLLISTILSLMLILSYKENRLFADEIVLLLIFPGLDMLRLFIARILQNKNPFSADTNHLHHLIIKKNSLGFTLFLTTGLQGIIFFAYFLLDINIIYFFIFLVFYYLTLYLIFRNKSYV